jgi:hypothetical protein
VKSTIASANDRDLENRITVNTLKARLIIAALVFAGILLALWVGSSHSAIAVGLGSYFPRSFAAFALLLAVLWLGVRSEMCSPRS